MNAWICWRLFHTEYLNHMLSIEGAFISLDRYITQHWPLYDWFPLWLGGYPFPRSYQPLLHYTVAAVSALAHISPALSYHFITALTYSLGGVAFYFLANSLIRSRAAAFCGAMLFSTFSPSLLLLPAVRQDATGWRNARRLQAMVVYGEGLNITGLTLAILAVALLHRAIERERPADTVLAAVAIALVAATNWPATMALIMAILAYVIALDPREFGASFRRVIAMGAIAAGLVLPFALPSTVIATFRNANLMGDAPTPGLPRVIGFAVLFGAVALIRFVLAGAPFAIRFPALWMAITGGVVIGTAWAGVRLLPQAMRFHLAMEIAIILFALCCGYLLCSRSRLVSRAATAAVLLFCAVQAWQYRHYARSIIEPVQISTTIEYEEARWFQTNMPGARVHAPGSVSFWMNVFANNPQLTGCCEQSAPGRQDFIAAYITSAGFHSDAESADYSLLWEKAFGVQAVAAGGQKTREYYHAFQFPYRFRDKLPLLWRDGDDAIYRIPERARGLCRVVWQRDLVADPPENGIDVKELRPFVAALDDPSLPDAVSEWPDTNHARIRAAMTSDQVISVAMNYVPGWTATANGRAVPVAADGLGLIVVQPRCEGNCEIHLRWSPGPEPWICIAICAFTLAGCLVWWRRAAILHSA